MSETNHTETLTETVGTYGLTERAAAAIVAAGGRVRFESCPGAPAGFALRQPVIYVPEGSESVDRVGPYSGVGFVLPGGLRITADYVCRVYRLRSGAEAENGPNAEGAGDWGVEIKASDETTCAFSGDRVVDGDCWSVADERRSQAEAARIEDAS